MSAGGAIWLDGERARALPLPDRGLDFGDGLFETLLLHEGRAQFTELHMARLHTGAEVLSLPIAQSDIEAQLHAACAAAEHYPWAALRLTLTRGTGPRGYAPPSNPRPRVVMQLTPLDRACNQPAAPAVVGLPAHGLSHQPVLAGIKHLNRLDQVLAAQQMQVTNCDEGVMLDQSGGVVSLIAGNLFLVEGDTLVTPPLTAAGVRGTRRQLVLHDWAARAGLSVREEAISLEQVHAASECFYTNALYGLRAVARCGQSRWQAHPVAERLFGVYREALS